MRVRAWLAAAFSLGAVLPLAAVAASSPQTPPSAVTFEKDVAPLLKARCQPCHYPGGTMYSKLPFDRSETARLLGTKLFTRIKDEKSQALIRQFLDAKPLPKPTPNAS